MKPAKTQVTDEAQHAPRAPKDHGEFHQTLRTKHSLWLLGGLLGLMIIAAIGFFYLRSRAPSPQPYQGSLQKIRVSKIGVNPLLHTIAESKGYFAQNGLEPETVNYATGPLALEDLVANKLDIALAADFAGVNFIFKNPQLRIIAAESQQDSFSLVIRTDKGLDTPANLKNKKIGVSLKGAGEFFLARFLTLNDVNINDVTLVDLLPADMITQVSSGQLDAAVLFEPSAFNLKKELGTTAALWPIQGEEKVFAALFSTEDFVTTRPDLIERYLKSLIMAQDFIKANPQGAKEILAKAGNFAPDYVDYIWAKTHYILSLEQSLLLAMEEQARFLIDSKATTQTTAPNYLNYIYFDGLERAKPTAINIIH